MKPVLCIPLLFFALIKSTKKAIPKLNTKQFSEQNNNGVGIKIPEEKVNKIEQVNLKSIKIMSQTESNRIPHIVKQ